jgi:ABC-2 type transport system permease protein
VRTDVQLLAAQIRYQARLLLSNARGLVIGVGLPIILLVASKGKSGHPDVSGYAVFGLTMTAWNTYGLRLVAARESGVLKRWRATPLPRWCYFVGSILASAVVAVLAGTATVIAALLIYGRHFGDSQHVYLTGVGTLALVTVCFLGALAFAGTVTALTSVIPSVEAALPTLMLIYFPLVIVSGVLFSITEPGWLSTVVSYLPVRPLVDSMTRVVWHTPGDGSIPIRDIVVLASWAIGGILGAVVFFRWEPHRQASTKDRVDGSRK